MESSSTQIIVSKKSDQDDLARNSKMRPNGKGASMPRPLPDAGPPEHHINNDNITNSNESMMVHTNNESYNKIAACIPSISIVSSLFQNRCHNPHTDFLDKLTMLVSFVELECLHLGKPVEKACIGWILNGHALIIRDQVDLVNRILPIVFGNNRNNCYRRQRRQQQPQVRFKFSSFLRKLQRWGFRPWDIDWQTTVNHKNSNINNMITSEFGQKKTMIFVRIAKRNDSDTMAAPGPTTTVSKSGSSSSNDVVVVATTGAAAATVIHPNHANNRNRKVASDPSSDHHHTDVDTDHATSHDDTKLPTKIVVVSWPPNESMNPSLSHHDRSSTPWTIPQEVQPIPKHIQTQPQEDLLSQVHHHDPYHHRHHHPLATSYTTCRHYDHIPRLLSQQYVHPHSPTRNDVDRSWLVGHCRNDERFVAEHSRFLTTNPSIDHNATVVVFPNGNVTRNNCHHNDYKIPSFALACSSHDNDDEDKDNND